MSGDQEGLTLEQLNTTVLYDIFQDAANALSAEFFQRHREAVTADQAAEWWAKVMELRDETARVGPYDRDQLTAHIRRWRRETETLKSP